MPSIDFARLKELITVPRYLMLLGGPPPYSWHWSGRCWCPIHSAAPHHSRSLAVHPREYYCHRCRRGGGVLDLAMILMDCTLSEAARRLCELCGVDIPYIPRAAVNRRPRNRKMAP